MPLLSLIVPNVPLISSDNAAFMPPDERLAIDELIDIEFQRLGDADIGRVEIDVVGEIVDIGNYGMTGIGETLRRKITDQMIVPKRIGIDCLPSNIRSGGIAGESR